MSRTPAPSLADLGRRVRRHALLAGIVFSLVAVVTLVVVNRPVVHHAGATVGLSPTLDGTPDTVRLLLPSYATVARESESERAVDVDVLPDSALVRISASATSPGAALDLATRAIERIVTLDAGDPLVRAEVLVAPHDDGSTGGISLLPAVLAIAVALIAAAATVAAASGLRPMITRAALERATRLPVVPVHRRVRLRRPTEHLLDDPYALAAGTAIVDVVTDEHGEVPATVVVFGGSTAQSSIDAARLCAIGTLSKGCHDVVLVDATGASDAADRESTVGPSSHRCSPRIVRVPFGMPVDPRSIDGLAAQESTDGSTPLTIVAIGALDSGGRAELVSAATAALLVVDARRGERSALDDVVVTEQLTGRSCTGVNGAAAGRSPQPRVGIVALHVPTGAMT